MSQDKEYFMDRHPSLACKNELQKKIYDWSKKCDNRLVKETDISELLKGMQRKISEYNNLHKRCKPETLSYGVSPSDENNFIITIGHYASWTLKLCRHFSPNANMFIITKLNSAQT